MEIALIAAIASNGVIGRDGDMPWHLPEDLRHFKETTVGSPVIMGRKTYDSIVERIDGPLPDRATIVLTKTPERIDHANGGDGLRSLTEATEVHAASSVDEALALAVTYESDTVYVAGGATVYEQYLPVADRLVLTEINEVYEGDTVFPEWDSDDWVELHRDSRDGFAFVEYIRHGRSES